MSGETVEPSAWLNPYRRKQYIEIFERMKDKNSTAMSLLFPDHEDAAKKHFKELEQEYATVFNWETIDPADVYQIISEKAYEFYESELLMEHNFYLSFLSNMYQIFEQQLRSFIYEELNHRLSPIRTKSTFDKFGANMNEIRAAYQIVGYNLENNASWDTVYTLSDIANAFKHGDGRSAKRLYTKHPDYFKVDSFNNKRVMDYSLTTNSTVVFEIKKIDFNVYANAIISFWTEFPEHLQGSYTFED